MMKIDGLFSGDLERLSRFWMSGTCKPNEQEKRASEPLSIAQFLSAFLLLAIGMAISIILLLMEHFYMRYLQSHVQKTSDNGCCALISQVHTYFFIRVGNVPGIQEQALPVKHISILSRKTPFLKILP